MQNARPFITHHNCVRYGINHAYRYRVTLLKRLVVGGMERNEIGRVFPVTKVSITHNPEFTSIEIYTAYTDYKDVMDLTEGIISDVAKRVLGQH